MFYHKPQTRNGNKRNDRTRGAAQAYLPRIAPARPASSTLIIVLFLSISHSAIGSAEQANHERAFHDAAHMYPIIKEGKYGFIDEKGNVVIEPKYDSAAKFSEGLAAIRMNGKVGYIDTEDKIVIEPIYNSIPNPSFSGGLAVVRTDAGNSGFINKDGVLVIKDKYQNAQKFSEGLAAVKTMDGKYGFINKDGAVVIKPVYDMAIYFTDGMASVGIGDDLEERFGFINRKGEMVINPKYEFGSFFFREGIAAVSESFSAKPYCIDKSGKKIIDSPCGTFREGLAAVEAEEKWGYKNKTGDFAIKPSFEGALNFSEGFAGVKVDGKWGFINKTAEIVIAPKYDMVGLFSNGIAAVSIGGKSPLFLPWGAKGYGKGSLGYIDRNGDYIWKPVK